MPSSRIVIDIVFIALVIVAVSISAVIIARAMTNTSSTLEENSAAEMESFESKSTGRPGMIITDPDTNSLQDSNQDPSVIEDRLYAAENFAETAIESSGPLDHPAVSYIYESSPIILPITWGAVAGTVIWRGKVRSKWSRQGYDYDTFRLISKMRGSQTRIKLLNAVRDEHKNKLQLAKELDVDWKTVDNHAEMLVQARLIEESDVVGTARYYSITENGRRVLSLLAADELQDGKE
ncbi:MAG: winged helix-turn-helix domain-containing protein [Nitrososphaera sp.]|uniref:winged helix-turn-helix domain-containing protein n=1 Tax=Nitrososphaera sp. TaxID=1971748 RepID=UPI003D6DFA25